MDLLFLFLKESIFVWVASRKAICIKKKKKLRPIVFDINCFFQAVIFIVLPLKSFTEGYKYTVCTGVSVCYQEIKQKVMIRQVYLGAHL